MVYRRTDKPGKQLIYLALERDGKLSKGKRVGADFGCKAMKNRPVFKTAEYYGIDRDETSLARGMAANPSAKAVHASIQEAGLPPVDFGICVSVFHGTGADAWEPMPVLESIVRAIAPAGILVVTLKPKTPEFPLMLDLLYRSFDHVDVKGYGLANKTTRFALPMAYYHLYLRPEPPKEAWFRAYCLCIGRKPS